MRGGIAGGAPLVVVRVPLDERRTRRGRMIRRRLAAVALAALTAVLLTIPGIASGAQAGDQTLVRVAHFAPGLLKGDVYVV